MYHIGLHSPTSDRRQGRGSEGTIQGLSCNQEGIQISKADDLFWFPLTPPSGLTSLKPASRNVGVCDVAMNKITRKANPKNQALNRSEHL